MTTRAIKKLIRKDDLKLLHEKLDEKSSKNAASALDEEREEEEEGEDDDDEGGDEQIASFCPKNKFNFLIEDDGNSSSREQSDKESKRSDDEMKLERAPSKSEAKTKKKKKRAKHKAGGGHMASSSNEFKFVSTEIDEAGELLGQAQISDPKREQSLNESFKNSSIRRNLFQIESKNLNSDNEMMRMFGARIVQSERLNASSLPGQRGMHARRNAKYAFKTNSIVNVKNTWPPFRRNGLSMRVLSEDAATNTLEFAFEHDKDYQHVQFTFLDAIDSMEHTSLMAVLHLSPYHIDSLIQLSEVSRVHDDTQTAADLIERALYAFQNSFHPSFNFSMRSSPTIHNLKLDYNRVENRSFFIALFKHILYVGGKACYRTSLELCKLLLSLNIETDPLAVILLVDFYAIRASQYEYLIEFYAALEPAKHLSLMPNMLMSVALAHFYLHRQSNRKKLDESEYHLSRANELLRDALVKFPCVLMDLLDKCGVMADRQAETCWIFARHSHLKTPPGLKYLIGLYVSRMHHEWKIGENLSWLEQTVRNVIEEEKTLESKIKENKKKFESLFAKVPPNIYRHLILSDIKEVTLHLPAEYPSTATYTFDPIPPKNSIVSYTRPARSRQSANDGDPLTAGEHILSFFQSLLPANAADLNQRQQQNNNAAGRFDVRQLMANLREFLANNDQVHAQNNENDAADGAARDQNENNDDYNEID